MYRGEWALNSWFLVKFRGSTYMRVYTVCESLKRASHGLYMLWTHTNMTHRFESWSIISPFDGSIITVFPDILEHCGENLSCYRPWHYINLYLCCDTSNVNKDKRWTFTWDELVILPLVRYLSSCTPEACTHLTTHGALSQVFREYCERTAKQNLQWCRALYGELWVNATKIT